MRLLLAVDESENAKRAVQYVGALLKRTRHVSVTLFHVLSPMPRILLEHGGSENPAIEKQLSAQLRKEQEAWLNKESHDKHPILMEASEMLITAGIDANRIAMKFGHDDDVAIIILEEAKTGHHDTIVIGRTGKSGGTSLFGGGVTDRLLRDAKGLALWVID